jgi:hypothetical protein
MTTRGAVSGRPGLILVLLGAICLACAAVARAGAPARPAAAAAPTAPAGATVPPARKEGQAPPKGGIFDERPDEHYEQRDRVDPFTLGEPSTAPPPPPPPPPDGDQPAPAPADYWGNKLAEVRKTYASTELVLNVDAKDRYTQVISDCSKHIPALQGDIRELLKKPDDAAKHLYSFQLMLEKFQRLEATAQRLQLRVEVEADFASKKIVVDGIVWRPQSPAAAVNGQMVTEGSVLRVGGGKKEDLIQVYRIRRHSVVFMYRGIQVSAYLRP